VGNSEPPIKEILILIEQLKKDLPSGRHFEFGDDPDILKKIEKHIQNINRSLDALNNFYASRPMPESNPYYQAVRITHETQNFIEEVRKKEANKENTVKLRDHIHELEEVLTTLLNTQDTNYGSEEIPNSKSDSSEIIQNSPPPTKHNVTVDNIQSFSAISQNRVVNKLSQEKPQRLVLAFKTIIAIPKPLGRFILDLFGRHDSAESSSIIMGWLFIIVVFLIILGFVPLDVISTKFTEGWRFFFPVK